MTARAETVKTSEAVDLETLDDLEFYQTVVGTIAEPAYNHAVSAGVATVDREAFNQSVLDGVISTLTGGRSVSELYETMKATLAAVVATLGETKGLGAGERISLRSRIENSLSRIHGPFYNISRIAEFEGIDSLVAKATEDSATWSTLVKFARDRMDLLYFDPEHWDEKDRLIHYQVKGVELSITVKDAAASRREWINLLAKAAELRANNFQSWSAVQRQYRLNNPAGIIDGRVKANPDTIPTVVLSGAEAVFYNGLTADQRDKLRLA